MAKLIGELKFQYKDHTEDEYNNSVDCTFEIWGKELDGMDVEEYYRLCRRFGKALGYAEQSINEWFGEY